MTEPEKKPSEKVKPHEVAGLGCCGLVVLYAIFGVYRFVNPPRPVWLQPAVRETRNEEEKAIRRYIESLGYFGSDVPLSELLPAKATGGEPRSGVSLYEVCNFTDKPVDLYFDGVEIVKLQVAPRASVALELKSGLYDCVKTGMGIKVFYARTTLAGTYHDDLVFAGQKPTWECPGQHPVVRKPRE